MISHLYCIRISTTYCKWGYSRNLICFMQPNGSPSPTFKDKRMNGSTFSCDCGSHRVVNKGCARHVVGSKIMKKVLLVLLFCMGTVAYAQIPQDLITSDPATNHAIAVAIQQYGEQAVREALKKGNANQSTSAYQNQNNGYQNNPYQNNSYQNNNQYNGYQNDAYNNTETVISGVYFSNGQTVVVNLKYSHQRIVAYSTSTDMAGRYVWKSVLYGEIGQTNNVEDGQAARYYRYKIKIDGTPVYFNLQ